MKVLMYDEETLLEYFLIVFYKPEDNSWYSFGVNRWKNQLDALMKFLEEHEYYYQVGYNNLGFDAQILEYIVRNHKDWYDLANLEICRRIHQKAQDTIDNQSYGLFTEYREDQLTYKQIDLPRIWHFFNEKKRISLKALEFSMNMENIEEMPIDHNKKNLSLDDIKLIDDYCKNDVLATYHFYLYTIGEVDDPLYKGQNKILDRQIIEQETGLKCLNWDDVKIGAEWNKLDYINATGRKEIDLKPKRVNHFFGKKYKQFFPKTVTFQTPELQKFIKKLGETYIKREKQEFNFDFSLIGNVDLVATIARGGIHSCEKNRFLKPTNTEKFLQNDIGSQYPNAIRKFEIYPSHLGIEWNKMLVSKIERRLKYKKIAKETKNRKYNSLQEMAKLSLNGGAL